MILARLDNEVFFKKAFTDRIVFKAFVKDIIGIDIEPDKIETEKAFQPKIGNINFQYDIFAEDIKKRIDKLYRDYIRFINKFYIREITHQEQGIEMYDMMIKSMNINTQIKGLDDEIAELHQYSNNIEQQKQTEQQSDACQNLPSNTLFSI